VVITKTVSHIQITPAPSPRPTNRARASIRRLSSIILVIAVLPTFLGCASSSAHQSTRIRPEAVYDIHAGRYDAARRKLRRHSLDRNTPDVILDNLRLAVASIHDGAFYEAKLALMRAYPYLVTGTVNKRNAENAAFFSDEGHLVWKGEPFEQAAAWYFEALVPMIEGDWENTRAAAKNMLFTLVDFAGSPTIGDAMKKAESPEWFDKHKERIESDLVLGYLLLGISEYWQARDSNAVDAFNHARKLRPDLKPLINTLQNGNYNTLLVVEAEPGPRKQPHGRYGEYFTFQPVPKSMPAPLLITDEDGNPVSTDLPDRLDAVDFDALAQHPRWWSMKSLRETKRAVGDILTAAGTGAVIYGSVSKDDNAKDKALLAGIAAIAVGQAIASWSAADLRYFDVLPRTVYLVPLQLEPGPHTIRLSLPNQNLDSVRHFIMPGYDTLAVYAIRLEKTDALNQEDENKIALKKINHPIQHPNDVTGPIPGSYPYILGGTDVSTPTEEVLQSYQQSGYLLDYSIADLLDLYREEGIVLTPLPANRETTTTYHHILRPGGRWLYTPVPGSKGFEDLTYKKAPPYQPKSQALIIARQNLQHNSQKP